MLVDSTVFRCTPAELQCASLPRFGTDIKMISNNEVQHDLSGADGIRQPRIAVSIPSAHGQTPFLED
jgi:hypothetical protein